ncbi:hypothetical protein F5H01DRAFT_349913, partial [Linnemannia elongata]
AVVVTELELVAVAVAATLVLVLVDAEDDDEVWPVKANRRLFNFSRPARLMDVLLQRFHRREQRIYLDSEMSDCT